MKIVLTGGGTAGHVMPCVALAEKLCNKHTLYYIGTNGIEKQIVGEKLNGKIAHFYTISASKLVRKLTLSNLLLPFKLIRSITQCKRILKEIAPDVVFSKGGFVGLPVVIAAKILKIKTIVHESDMTLGLANKISFMFADVKLSAFELNKNHIAKSNKENNEHTKQNCNEINNLNTKQNCNCYNVNTKQNANYCQEKRNDSKAKNSKSNDIICVGAMLRDFTNGSRQKGLATMGFTGKRPILLVTGGSLGATALNNAIANSKNLAKTFDIFVITGKGKKIETSATQINNTSANTNFVTTTNSATQNDIKQNENFVTEINNTKTKDTNASQNTMRSAIHQAEFVGNMQDIFASADICLTRAGANTLAELTTAKVPFCAVPLTKQSRGEQVKNAKYFEQKGCGIVLDENNLDKLENALLTLLRNKNAFQTAQSKLNINGTEKVAQIIENQAKRDE